MDKIRVLQISESTGKGGSRNYLCSLAHSLDKNRFEVDVICSLLRDRDFYQDIKKMQDAGIKVIILPIKRNISLLSDLAAFFKLCSYIKKGRYDVVHTHSSKAGFLGRLAARLMGTRTVIHTPHYFCFITEDMPKVKKLFYFYLEKFAALFCDRIITVSESQRQDILKKGLVNAEKVITVENGVDIRKFSGNGFDALKNRQKLGLGGKSVVLGTVGILIERKGQRYLIEAFAEIIKEGFDMTLLIAGDGELRRELENLCGRLGLDSRVRLLGFRQDIPELLSLMDIFVFPSLWEGMPLAVLEAMASGLPVVCTEAHGAVDLIQNGKCGILVQKRDAKGIIEAIRYLVLNPDKAKGMGREARRLIHSNYTLEKQVSRIEEIYKSSKKGAWH